MSRFFRQAGDSSESEESEEEELLTSSDEESEPEAPARKTAAKGMDRFLSGAGDTSSDDSDDDDDDLEDSDEEEGSGDEEDEGKQRIMSAHEKRLAEMESTGKAIDNALRINNWVAISTEYDKLARMVQRQSNIAEPTPPFFVRTLTGLEESVNTAISKDKTSQKKTNAANAKAMTAMKQKIKKSLKEYETDVTKFKEDPEAFEKAFALATAPKEVPTAPVRRAAADRTAEEEDDDDAFQQVGRGGRQYNFTTDSIYKNLQAIQEARGKKNTDRAEQIRILEKLLEVAVTSYQQIRILLSLVSSRFDYNTSVTTHMPIEMWLHAQKEVDQLLTIISNEPAFSIQETTEEYDEMAERSPATEQGGIVRVRGSIISFVDRLDDEFTKSLQNIDPHGPDYVERLKDEKNLYCTICRAQGLYEKSKQDEPTSRVVMRRLEHIYSKPDAVIQALESALESSAIQPSMSASSAGSTSALINALCVHLYKSGNTLLRTRAMLSQIYHHALHNDFHTARDMMLMSHLQESIHSADVATQILYNRTVVQLGLSAFRSGLIKEAQATLLDIFSTQRVKELLAQGVHTQQRYAQQLTPEQEKAEKQRQLPFHMHINTELLEAAFLVSSMLVEIPVIASIDSDEAKRKAISKPFRRLLDSAERQVFTGPPETTRDHVVQASRALMEGDWEKCRDLVQSIKIWSLMPEASKVKEMLGERIQQQGLRTYLFAYSPFYTSLSLARLAQTFNLPPKSVHSLVSKMIWSEELSASLDQSGGVVVFHRVEVSRAQQLALSVAEKVNGMVELNEKTLDGKLGSGSSGGWGDRDAGGGGGGDKGGAGGQQQERRGRREGARGGGSRGRGARFAQGLGNRMPGGGGRGRGNAVAAAS